MEGMVTSAVLKLAVAKLASAIGDQVMMQWNLKKNLEDMKDTLEYIAKVLKDAERRSITEEPVLLWLKKLKNAAFDISDMLDDFQDGKRTGLLSHVRNAAKNIGLPKRMKKLKQQLRKIQEDHVRFQLTRDSGGTIEQQITDQRETIAGLIYEDVVGREEEKKDIVGLLLERNSKEVTIIVPIHGLGGVGKTTLARLVFNDTHFKEYDHRVWVYVSQVLDLKKIGNNIISQVSTQESHDLNDLQSIFERLKELLNDGQKCLIVLDDLWEEKTDELGKLKTMLIKVGKAGSKIDVIVTTRKEEIAQNIRTGKPYHLKPLDDTMCWSIIKKRCNFESRPDKEQLEQIGQDIANKCAGIALAAQALGYMLSGMNPEEWSAMRDNYIWSLSKPEDTSFPLPSLMLSYQSMPSYLKLCFGYCAIFPKGHNIRKYDLIHQWIALDFIEPSRTFSATQLGEMYVRQLLGMSFLHHSDLLSSTSQRLAVFTMHDIVHDLATSVTADELLVSDAEKGCNSSRNKYCRCVLLANYSGPTKLSAIFPAKVRALRFLDCGKLELHNDAFSFAKSLRVLDFSGCPFSKLPKCVTQLSRLQYLNLHGSRQISALPESLGNLKSLVHLELSRCSRVVAMPKAFCGLTKLQYLNFSWCSNLGKLPEDIGSLTELQYLDLSYCRKLGELPESFQKLHNLVHLDLSGCFCLKGIPGALDGLTKLQYLSLSGMLDPIFRSLLSDESSRYVECISALTNIEHLDLSCNKNLNYLPESLGNLKRLHTLDISQCSGLDSIPESIGAIRRLKFIKVRDCSNQLKVHMTHSPLLSKFVKLACFMVHANGNLHLLDDVNHAELEICSLENVRFLEEAHIVKLFEKQNLSELTFDWALDACRLLEDKDVLEELVPPRGLKHLGLRGYSSIELPTWLMGIISSPPYLDVSHRLPNLVKIKLENLPRCNNLPPLGQLPNLEELQLIRLCSITKIGEDLCGGGGAFRRLSTFTLENMERLEEWSTTYSGMEFMFPNIETLKTLDCPSLRLKPCPPIFSYWCIRSSDKVISSWGERGHINVSSSTPATRLKVEYSKVPMDKWRLLHHIPTLQELELSHCDYLVNLPENMRHLVSLRSLELSCCGSISVLPEWMGDFTSLESLTIFTCESLKSLPQCVQQLTKLKELKISWNYELMKWCESEENKIKLAHIKKILRAYPGSCAAMAGMLASAVLKLVAAKLASAIGDQVMMQWKLKDNLEDMKDTLESMAAVLKDAERRSIREASVLLWLKRLKNAAYDISDMLDDFQDGKRTGLVSYVPIAAKNIGLANRIKKMKQQLRKIKEDHGRFQFSRDSGGTIEQQITDQRETIAGLINEDVVGREEEKKDIVGLLLERNSEEETIIVPIHGLGGIGKTTLARLVFNDTHFKEYDHRVWVYVSQVLDLKKIGNTIISRVSEQGSQDLNDLESIYQRLKKLLNGKKCLIVLDDLWEGKTDELEKLKTMLIKVGKAGSKIDVIVTTRDEEIAQNIGTGKSYDLKPLDDTMCWSIIKKRCNFESRTDKEQLEQVGQDMASKCAGIALAARALGHILSGENLEERSAIRDSDIWNESSLEDTSFPLPLRSLMLSYQSMPPYLKLCFAYCAIFPKGHNIRKYDLIHQWIALNFIEPSRTYSATQLGEMYVRQLLGMSFLHHSDLSSTSQREALFTMHDLVHDLATSVMADELLVSDAKNGSKSSRNKYCRCAFLTNYSETTKLSAIFPAKVRALRFLDCQLRNDAFSFAKYLRVLDLSGCSSSELPKCVTQLSRLQYLNLQGSDQISALPESIGKIERLMHLDLKDCSRLVELPKAFSSLTKLQYLNFSCCSNLKKLPEDIGSLTELQYLNLSRCGKLGELPESFQKLHNLVHLDLSSCRGVKGIPGALGGLTKLQYLNLSHVLDPIFRVLPSDESRRYVKCIGALTNIEHLDLSRNRLLNYLPESLGNLKRLHTLDISHCSSLDSIPKSLGNLKSLQTLNISHCSGLDSIPESLGNLESLHTLDTSHCSGLDSIPESLGNLESLHTLDISHCSGLDSIPESIGAIRTLKFIKVEGCSDEMKVHMTHSPLLSKFVQFACFMVQASDVNTIGNLRLLEYVNHAELEICSLENVRFLEEAQRVELFEKQNLSGLTFDWALDACRLMEDKDVLEELVPPRGLKHLGLRGYTSIDLPTWLMGIISSPPYLDASHHLPNLVKIKLENVPRCNNLPPLGQLPNLEELHLIGLCSITKIGEDLCGRGGAFSRLSTFTLKNMERLEEWSTTYCGEDGVEEFMFPKLKTLETSVCPSLRLKPCPPIFSNWYIGNFFIGSSADKVISSWGEGGHISVPSSTPVNRLKVESSKVPMDKWRLLHHIPTLQELELRRCDYLASLPESMRHLVSLRSLELSFCRSISVLPEWMGDLTSLESLKINVCNSLKSLPQCVQQLTKLKELKIWGNNELKKWCESEENKIKLAHIKTISFQSCDPDPMGDSDPPEDNSVSLQLFMVSDVNTCSKLHQLEDVNLKELKLSCLENVRSLEEAHKIKLLERRSLSKLTLEWTSDEDRFLEKEVLGELVPPRGLQHLELDGYSCISFPTWLMGISDYLPNLIEIKLENLPQCSNLSPLGQLPNLDKLHLGRLQSMKKIDRDFYCGEGAFLRLSEFTLYYMEQLEEWNTTYCREDGVEEFMFPKLHTLDIKDCPKLRLTPRPPIFLIWKIQNSDMVISSWGEGDHISHSPSDTPDTTLKVLSSKVSVGEWRLLHHLPTLQVLEIKKCHKLTSLPENTQHLASLRSLQLFRCNGISALPEWLGHLTSLERLDIKGCRSIKSLPHCIQQLTKLKELQILSNRKLKKWCESDENKMKLAHIENIRYVPH